MRFFAHDGKTTHGPATVEDLLRLPGFDGNTLVCPVGSANSEDWKPALAYPPFKRALLFSESPASDVPSPAPAEPPTKPDPSPPGTVADVAAPPSRVPFWKRPTSLLGLAGAAIFASGMAWRMLAPPPAPRPEPAPPISAPAPVPLMPTPAPAPKAPVLADSALLVVKPLPAVEIKPTVRRPVKSKTKRAPRPEPAVDEGKDPELESLLSNVVPDPKSPAEAEEKAPKEPEHFSLPGLDRPVGAGDQDGDHLALAQVHEQFDFCAQLLAQSAFGDHYDTCLCKNLREAAPYRGRKSLYVLTLKKDASTGRLESAAKIAASKLDGGAATVTARWKSRPNDRGHDVTQIWRLEDGLWCRAL